jgi:hypothetical protein
LGAGYVNEKTKKLLKLKIEKLMWLLSSLIWFIMALVVLEEHPLGSVIFVAIGISLWRGQNKEKWEEITKTEEYVRNNWQ